MSVFRDMSIGQKLTVIILSITTVSLLLACAVLVGYDLVMYRRAVCTAVGRGFGWRFPACAIVGPLEQGTINCPG